MAVSVSEPVITQTRFVERFGEVVEIHETRVVGVTGAPASSTHIDKVLDDTSVTNMQNGAPYSTEYGDVVLEERSVVWIAGKVEGATITSKYQIDLTYRLRRSSVNIDFSPGISVALNQITTTRDREGRPLKVADEFGPDSSIIQTAEMQVFVPQVTTFRERTFIVDKPEGLAAQFVGRVNENAWYGYDPQRWLITSCEAERVKLPTAGDVNATYLFRFTFETSINPKGWIEEIAYRDISGNVPEAGSIETNRGVLPYKPHYFGPYTVAEVLWYETLRYEDYFPEPA